MLTECWFEFCFLIDWEVTQVFSTINALWNHEETMQSLVFASTEHNSTWILILRKCNENLQQRVASEVCQTMDSYSILARSLPIKAAHTLIYVHHAISAK